MSALTLGCGGLEEPGLEGELEATEAGLAELEYDETARMSGVGIPTEFFVLASYGAGSYQSNGDYIWLNDGSADSMSVGIHWRTLNSAGNVVRRGICRHTHGANTIGRCNKNFPEDVRIEFRLGRCNGSTGNCRTLGHWQDWTAWGRYRA
jgi:hypothetical protein